MLNSAALSLALRSIQGMSWNNLGTREHSQYDTNSSEITETDKSISGSSYEELGKTEAGKMG